MSCASPLNEVGFKSYNYNNLNAVFREGGKAGIVRQGVAVAQ